MSESAENWLDLGATLALATAGIAVAVLLMFRVRQRTEGDWRRVAGLIAVVIAALTIVVITDGITSGSLRPVLQAALKFVTALAAWGLFGVLLGFKPSSPPQLSSSGNMPLPATQNRVQELQAAVSRLKAEIARRERIEHALREREGHLRLVLDAGRMGAWEWDLVTGAVQVDSRVQRLFGFVGNDARMTIEQVYEAIHTDDRQRVQSAADRSIVERVRFEEEFRVVRSDGTTIWVASRGEVIRDPEGRPSRMIGLDFEVTQRRRHHELLLLRDRALQNSTNGILIMEANRSGAPIVYANQAFELLTGYSQSEFLGRSWSFLQGPQTDRKAVARMQSAIDHGTDCVVTILNYRKDGTAFWNDVRLTPLRNAEGLVTHVVGMLLDATERHQTEETLRVAEARAQASNQAKSEFLANMSHEIRTPLTAVLGCADTLFPRLDREEHREMLQMIRNQGQMLLGILNDILDVSKIEAGRLEIHRQPCSIVAVIEEVRSLLGPQAADKAVELTTSYETEMPRLMVTDPLRVRQILVNLVGNAIKFTDQGFVTIIARCEISDHPQVQIIVRDTGIGIPPDLLEAVFEAFNQVHGDPVRRAGGTGLGLTISQRLVRMLGGGISAASEPGQGAEFTVTLPIELSEELEFVEPMSLAEDADQKHRSRDSIDVVLPVTVLVAEDTRGIQFMIRRMLEDAGATVAVVDNGERAVAEVLRAQAAHRPYDIVLMDMQMPVMNGFDATIRLRNLRIQVPIIALTAAAMQGDREKCLKSGCDEYLSKPVDRHALLDAIARQYNRRASVEVTGGIR